MPKKLTGENYPHTHFMTLEEWKKFVANYKSCEWDINKKISIKQFLLEYEHRSFMNMIINAFSWSRTSEGTDYWDNISDRTKPLC